MTPDHLYGLVILLGMTGGGFLVIFMFVINHLNKRVQELEEVVDTMIQKDMAINAMANGSPDFVHQGTRELRAREYVRENRWKK